MGIFTRHHSHDDYTDAFSVEDASHDRTATATKDDVIGFAVALGWEGPLIVALGLIHNVLFEVLGGLVITILLWTYIGLPLWSTYSATKARSLIRR